MRKKANKEKGRKADGQAGFPGGASALRPLVPLCGTVALIGAAVLGLERIKDRVYASPTYQPATIRLVLVNPPDWVIGEKWQDRILSAVTVPSRENWMKEDLTSCVADQLARSGWVKSVHRVAKRMDGTIEIAADYRRPIAMVKVDQGYVPVDRDGVRLPEVYARVEANSGWTRILGIVGAAPGMNTSFEEQASPDAVAAIRLASLIFDQGGDISSRISAIDVSNFRGRQDRRDCHIKLWTTGGTMIRWGSALGEEIEENSPAQKLAQIAMMLKRGGPQAQVDVSTLPDRTIISLPPTIETADISLNRRPR